MRHVPALDGLRGVAVAGVVAFHLGHLRGGYLGVDAFFVLSGYLITSLLVIEWRSTGTIDLRGFWVRRFRRLLPALVVLLLAVAAYALLAAPATSLGRLRSEGLAALAYVANWHAIVQGTSYWDQFTAPSPMTHLWSLGIEEQFYVVWPLLVVAVVVWWKRSLVTLLVGTVVLALCSAALMPLLYDGGDTSRVYFGTDTRAAAVLLGAALAMAVQQWGQVGHRLRWLLEAAAGFAAAGLVWAWFTVPGTAAGLYRGGFLLCGVAVTVVIAAITHDRPGPIAWALSARPLQWLGRVSYGLYLWHWPMIVWLSPARTGLDGGALVMARIGAGLALTVASYVLIEQPIRHGRLRGNAARVVTPAALVGTALALVVATAGAVAPAQVQVTAPTVPVAPPSDAPSGSGAPVAPGDPRSPGGGDEPGAARAPRVLVVGDSGAFFLGEAMAQEAGALGLEVRAGGTISCGLAVTGGGVRLPDGTMVMDPDWCAGWPERYAAEAAAFLPDVAIVSIAWPGIGDRRIGDRWEGPCDAGYADYYRGELRTAAEALGATGATVMFATAPYFASDIAPGGLAERVDCLNALYREAGTGAGRAVLDLFEFACPDGRCVSELDGVVLRPDALHFTEGGAVKAAAWIAGQLAPVMEARREAGGS
jgi:peptidoglycan/LPS O-acetylase OafA/YrhL